jgi:phosphate-selective porin OprO/OprP
MWDAPTKKFVFRQTQIVVAVPEIWGYIAVGRTKEGISLNKVMIGYAGWTMERATISDATIPILADGIKWIGHIPEKHFLWNVGFYMDALSEGQAFSTYDHQAVGRFVWLPLMSEEEVLHIGLNLRYGKPNEGELQLRSRPEAFPAPFVVDTGKYPVKDTKMAGVEAYYRPGPLLMGTEYYFQKQNSPEKQNPLFHGGEMFVSWLPTGEVRPYNTRGAYFDQISPNRTVFEGGPGAWELVARLSFIDLDSGPVRGGKFWRFTPMVNWFLSDNVRLEFAYGLGTLDRFDLTGNTQFFQTRIQLQL